MDRYTVALAGDILFADQGQAGVPFGVAQA